MSSERFTTIYDVVDKSLEIIVDNNNDNLTYELKKDISLKYHSTYINEFLFDNVSQRYIFKWLVFL